MEENAVSTTNDALVPRRLLALLHAPEVHQELGLTSEYVERLEEFLRQIDGDWFRSRLLAPEEQRAAVRQLETQTHGWLKKNLTEPQLNRLQQLEYQGQSLRVLCRDDVAQELKLTPAQVAKFVQLATETQAIEAEIAKNSPKPATEEQQSQLKAAAQAEHDALTTTLAQNQLKKLQTLLGEPFPLGNLSRIYPLAPEFHAVADWINSEPLTLEALRGKVVLVHFYAFQCHNCHANFEIYKKWHKELRDKGVVVVGIQTPETSAERDPKAVKKAAKEKGLEFPILIDLQSKNWEAWGNTMWPTVYVIDKRGYIRHWWQGELNWEGATGDKTIETVVQKALTED
jgi:peroxiredoxin